MREKYLKGVFGTCPRVLCDSWGLSECFSSRYTSLRTAHATHGPLRGTPSGTSEDVLSQMRAGSEEILFALLYFSLIVKS